MPQKDNEKTKKVSEQMNIEPSSNMTKANDNTAEIGGRQKTKGHPYELGDSFSKYQFLLANARCTFYSFTH